MPKVAIDHVEIRWRPIDTAGAWTTISIQPGTSAATLTGVQRGASYQIEARNVGKNGQPSAWTQQLHEVAGAEYPGLPTQGAGGSSGFALSGAFADLPGLGPNDPNMTIGARPGWYQLNISLSFSSPASGTTIQWRVLVNGQQVYGPASVTTDIAGLADANLNPQIGLGYPQGGGTQNRFEVQALVTNGQQATVTRSSFSVVPMG